MEASDPRIAGLAAALGIGLLIGIERERRKDVDPGAHAAGVRTHGLLALAGAVAVMLGAWVLAVLALGVAALAAIAHARSDAANPGLTSEVAILMSFLLGALAQSQPVLAGALGVAVAVLLAAKTRLHRITRELISEREMADLLLLAAAALIVLPLLPDEPIDPWGALRPWALGRLVVLVMAIGAAGHVALRLVGARWGLPIAGFFAGFASSTAATAGFGQRVRDNPALLRESVAAALLANLASLLLLVVVVGSVSASVLWTLRWPLTAAALTLAAGGAFGLWHSNRESGQLPPAPQARAFRLSHALLFAAIVGAVLLLTAWLRGWLGNEGAIAAATIASMVELHAAAAGLAQLAVSGELDARAAAWALTAILGASAVVKSVLAMSTGGIAYGVRVTLGLAAMLVAAIGATLLLVIAT